MKKFLILGNTLCFIISCNASDSNNVNLMNRNVLVSGILELSNHDTIINKSLEVQNNLFGKSGHNSIAELRLGKNNSEENKNNTTKVILNGQLIQSINGHVHLFNNMVIKEGATLFTTKYNSKHIKKEDNKTIIKDYSLSSKNTAGFDIDSGILTFNKGSNIMLSNSIKDNNNRYKNKSPVLYLCNKDSIVDISEVLESTYKPKHSKQEIPQQFKVHIVGTTDESGNRQGIVNIVGATNNISNLFTSNFSNPLENFGNNDIICENVKINTPSYKFQIVNENGNVLDDLNQVISFTSLKPATLLQTEDNNEIYDTVDKTETIVGIELNITNKEFQTNNIISILKNDYIDNSNSSYTLLRSKNHDTGIKIIPPINKENLGNVFTEEIEPKIVNITENQANILISFDEFIKSVRTSNDNKLKLTVYKQVQDGKYALYNDFLNDNKYTLNLDEYNNTSNKILPFKNHKISTEHGVLDMTSLSNNQYSNLPLYVNLQGYFPITWKLPNNQITEINLFGNNTNFTGTITLCSDSTNKHISKLVFGNNSFVKTNIENNIPITWEFVGNNDNVIQDNNSYASSINKPLSLLTIHNNNKQDIKVRLNNDNNNVVFNSCLYVNEVCMTSLNQNKSSNNLGTSLIISDNVTLRLINNEYKQNNPFCYLMPRNIQLKHDDSNFIIKNYFDALDSKAIYHPTSKFIEVTKSLQDQLNSLDINNNIGLYINVLIPNFSNSISNKINFILSKDNGNNKLQFSNMMEYVYNANYTYSNSSDTDEENFDQDNPHMYIPLLKIQNNNTNYYCITTFEIFPEYNGNLLVANFNNAVNNKNVSKSCVISNIYINGEQKQLLDENILFGDYNNEKYGSYLVFKEEISY